MTFLRFLAALLSICSSLVFAQQNADPGQSPKHEFSLFPDRPNFPFPNEKANASTGSHRELLVFGAPVDILNAPSRRELAMDSSCYAMRTYVVARDDKQSDSTHFVRYSTCQPASRYRLKSAQAHGNAELQIAPR